MKKKTGRAVPAGLALMAMVQPALVALLTGCTADGVCHGVYEALVRQHCQEAPGRSGCGHDRMTYDTYRQTRAQLLQRHEALDCTDRQSGNPTNE